MSTQLLLFQSSEWEECFPHWRSCLKSWLQDIWLFRHHRGFGLPQAGETR